MDWTPLENVVSVMARKYTPIFINDGSFVIIPLDRQVVLFTMHPFLSMPTCLFVRLSLSE